MIRRRLLQLLTVMLVVLAAGTIQAQGQNAVVAFVNNSGQLVAASGDGQMRWIITNPGEVLAEPLGFSWAPDGQRLFFAVSMGGVASLRVGDVASQSFVEIGQVNTGALSGGQWTPDGRAVLIAANDSLLLYPAGGGGPQVLIGGGGSVVVASPYAVENPNQLTVQALSPNGRYLFYWQAGHYVLYSMDNGSSLDLPGENDPGARNSGLWAGRIPLVAYWGFANGSSVLSVTDAATNQTITLNSGRSAPITPVAWRQNTTQLIYRDATNFVRIADVGCLESGCPGNPLESGGELLPATASDIQTSSNGEWVFFRDGESVQALNLNCLGAGNCLNSAVTLGQKAAQRTWVHAAGNTLVYTAYTQDASNPNDREVKVVNLACLSDPGSCQAESLLLPAVAGLVSPDGTFVTVDESGTGLNALNIVTLNTTYLSGSMGGQLGTGLNLARWG